MINLFENLKSHNCVGLFVPETRRDVAMFAMFTEYNNGGTRYTCYSMLFKVCLVASCVVAPQTEILTGKRLSQARTGHKANPVH